MESIKIIKHLSFLKTIKVMLDLRLLISQRKIVAFRKLDSMGLEITARMVTHELENNFMYLIKGL